MKGRKRKPWKRLVFTAGVRHDASGALWLAFERGARRIHVDVDGTPLDEDRDPSAIWMGNKADRVLLFGPSDDETAIAYVEHITQKGEPRVRVRVGMIATTTTLVRVMRMCSPRAHVQRPMVFANVPDDEREACRVIARAWSLAA